MKFFLLTSAILLVGVTGGTDNVDFLGAEAHVQCNAPADQTGCSDEKIPYLCPDAPEGESLMCCVWNHTQSYTRQQKIQLAGEINLGPPYGTCTTNIHWLGCTECPTDESLSDECNALVPPFPICCNENRTVADWADYSIDAADRCCKVSNDLSECNCPVKETEKFLDHIEDFCFGVGACLESDNQPDVLEAYLRGGLDVMEE